MNRSSDSDPTNQSRLPPLGLILVAVCAVWVLGGFGVHFLAGPDGRGTFGDMFGTVNALFSGLAFACLIYAVFMQKEELKLQRKELRLARREAAATRFEIQGQKEQAIAQNKTLLKQTFENLYVQLLRQHSDLVSSLTYGNRPDVLTGKDCLAARYHHLMNAFNGQIQHIPNPDRHVIVGAIRVLDNQLDDSLGHYFRSITSILSYVRDSDVDNKQFYVNLFRDSMTTREFCLMFYRCIESEKYVELKSLVEEFAFLQNLDDSMLLTRTPHKDLVQLRAFGH